MVDKFKLCRYTFCRVLHKVGLLKYFNFNLTRHGEQKKILIPIQSELGYFNLTSGEVWLKWILQDLKKNIDGVFVDIGVNLGQSLILHYALDIKNTYLGFEPNPTCYAYSRKLIKANKLQHYHLVPTGLSGNHSIVKLFGNLEHASGGSILENFRNNKEKFNKVVQYVSVMKGDDALKEIDLKEKIGLLKIDVEGAELDVLSGLTETIQKDKPLMIVEALPIYSTETENGRFRKQRVDSLLKLLKELNYCMYLIVEKSFQLKRINTIEVHSNMSETNYLFVHEDRIHEVEDSLETYKLIS
ncbi:MAG: FkbM family methyltransferase [Chitinophagales bacterium]|nr:FkbM family methyltransferase [Chitinophagales bacterium]